MESKKILSRKHFKLNKKSYCIAKKNTIGSIINEEAGLPEKPALVFFSAFSSNRIRYSDHSLVWDLLWFNQVSSTV